uniref:Phosphotyrosine protein phosphatase I domain-containing protein n=1 Tax=Hanusia phi TaxID=3032 RepID=A0A7S0DZA8_9CRYP|mmetsp:Transcript_12529/g.28797  ORF Transcript_12529/g.28797 Transcript_12529/m.28797 type:complete len:247 (+) Transcript_12529:152-892(+)
MLHLEGQRRRPGNWLLVTLIFISSLRSEAVEIPSSMDGTLTPEAHAQIYSNPTCLELMKHNRWRSWARRQNVDLRYAPSLVKLCFVCLTNTESSKLAETYVNSYIASNGLSHRLKVESRGVGGGRKDWYLPNGWSLFHGKEPDQVLVNSAQEFNLRLSGNAKPIDPESILDADHILCYGKEAYDELLEAASHWEKGGLLNDYLVKIRLMPALKWKEGDEKSKAKEAIQAFLEDCEKFLESLNLTKS